MTFLKILILILINLIIKVNALHGQTIISGYVTDENNIGISAIIKIIDGNGEFFFCDDNGYFDIIVPENLSLIEFSAIKYLPYRINIDTVTTKPVIIKMIFDLRYEEILLFAPSPPFIEFGYYGRLKNSPFGIHFSKAGWSNKHNLTMDYALKDFSTNHHLNFSYSPGIIDFKKNRTINNIINPYLIGVYSKIDSIKNIRAFICNSTLIKEFISINLGIGMTNENNQIFIYNLGLLKELNLPSFKPYIPLFYQSFVKFDIFMNKAIFDWSGKLYCEFYNRSYRRLSFAIGYESIYGHQDFILNVNFKNYIFKRDN